MNKVPWGIIAGVCAMILSFVIFAIITVFVVSGMMYSVAGGDDGLRESWWLVLLYVTAAVSFIGFGGGLFFYLRERRNLKEGRRN